ncbi:MAG: hypothetical protein AAF926_00600, partial [Pseudomonadota bacterium]
MTRRKMALLSSLLSVCLMGTTPMQARPDVPRPADLDYTGSVQLMPETGELVASWSIRIADSALDTITFGLSAAFGPAVVMGADVRAVELMTDSRFEGAVRTYRLDLQPVGNGPGVRTIRMAYSGPLFDPEPAFPINTLDP